MPHSTCVGTWTGCACWACSPNETMPWCSTRPFALSRRYAGTDFLPLGGTWCVGRTHSTPPICPDIAATHWVPGADGHSPIGGAGLPPSLCAHRDAGVAPLRRARVLQ